MPPSAFFNNLVSMESRNGTKKIVLFQLMSKTLLDIYSTVELNK